MTAHINPFGLRMQPDLRERLEAAAQTAGRSLNQEIVQRLDASFSSSPLTDAERDRMQDHYARGHTEFALQYLLTEMQDAMVGQFDEATKLKVLDLVEHRVEDILWRLRRDASRFREDVERSPQAQEDLARAKGREPPIAPPSRHIRSKPPK